MHVIADTEALVHDGTLTREQAQVLETRSREVMMSLAVNAILCFGIIAATAGLIVWLANPVAVAVIGALMLGAGLAVLARGSATYAMFGNSAVLIGIGMLLGGATVELIDKHEDLAGWILALTGLLVALICLWRWRTGAWSAHFVLGTALLMGLLMHLGGLEFLVVQYDLGGPWRNLLLLYYAAALALAGWQLNVRLVTALALIPFAQILETGTAYFHALYAFYSPEPTLTILQMALLVALCLWGAAHLPERDARHLRILAILGFIVANLCALVGALWGDVVGEHLWGPGRYTTGWEDYETYSAARDTFRSHALTLSELHYSVIWACALVTMILWAASRNQRGLFNTALTFAAIHFYTQMFESFADEPLAYVIGGLGAIPLAWGVWRLNQWMTTRQHD
ncbi:hypothetical protein [Phaeobacter sp. HF9A]|uniref:hypothetical protein n=1 Tax=Phaeobacter sp. HF9A TaxID=2721561 RepID=UPI0014304179|nr:hypothetical protein [Phaeobacter sp. HF9A]NIZ12160.1 hypothetical protein [Phaeobacter sp. HF9A]